MAQSTLSDASSGCQRLISVTGDKGKQNDVIVCGSVQSAKQHIIFFGGDVQVGLNRAVSVKKLIILFVKLLLFFTWN